MLSWYFKDEGDVLLRSNLDRLWVCLHDITLRSSLYKYFDKLVKRLNDTFPDKKRAMIFYFFFGFLLNSISAFVGYIIWAMSTYSAAGYDVTVFDVVVKSFEQYTASWDKFRYPLILMLLVSFAGVIVDLLSIVITWKLLKMMVKSKYISMVFVHLIFDIILAALAVVWALVVLFFFAYVTSELNLNSVTNTTQVFTQEVIKQSNKSFTWYGIVVGLTSCIPTLLYLMLGSFLAIVHIIPNTFRNIFVKIIYLITTDNKPVLTQLGNFSGGVAALLVGLSMII